jgi:hypothetical protein
MISLDLLIGTKRTDEAVELFGEWFGSRGAEEQAAEVAACRLGENRNNVGRLSAI